MVLLKKRSNVPSDTRPEPLTEKEIDEIVNSLPEIYGFEPLSSQLAVELHKDNLRKQLRRIKLCKTERARTSLTDRIRRHFQNALVEPGSMVGTIAAQYGNQAGVQNTLSSFKNAGSKITNESEQVIAIYEATKKIHFPSMIIHFTERLRRRDVVDMRALIEDVSIGQVLLNYTIGLLDIPESRRQFYNPTEQLLRRDLEVILKTQILPRYYWHDALELFQGYMLPSSYFLRLHLDVDLLYAHRISMEDLVRVIMMENRRGILLPVPGPFQKGILDIFFDTNKVLETSKQCGASFSLMVENLCQSTLDKIRVQRVKGIPKITDLRPEVVKLSTFLKESSLDYYIQQKIKDLSRKERGGEKVYYLEITRPDPEAYREDVIRKYITDTGMRILDYEYNFLTREMEGYYVTFQKMTLERYLHTRKGDPFTQTLLEGIDFASGSSGSSTSFLIPENLPRKEVEAYFKGTPVKIQDDRLVFNPGPMDYFFIYDAYHKANKLTELSQGKYTSYVYARTRGKNNDILKLPWVDRSKTTSNNYHATIKNLGIEAAHNQIFHRLCQLLGASQVSGLDPTHISIINERLLVAGLQIGLNRTGMKSQSESPINTASIGGPMEAFLNAAVTGSEESVNQPNPAIFAGVSTGFGSGASLSTLSKLREVRRRKREKEERRPGNVIIIPDTPISIEVLQMTVASVQTEVNDLQDLLADIGLPSINAIREKEDIVQTPEIIYPGLVTTQGISGKPNYTSMEAISAIRQRKGIWIEVDLAPLRMIVLNDLIRIVHSQLPVLASIAKFPRFSYLDLEAGIEQADYFPESRELEIGFDQLIDMIRLVNDFRIRE